MSVSRQDSEKNPLAIVYTDLDHTVTHCNEAFLLLTGYRIDEVLGQDWLSWNTPTLHWGKIYTKFFLTKLGGIIHVKIYSQHIESGYVNYVTDVTEYVEQHKQLLEKIKKEENAIKTKTSKDLQWKNKLLNNFRTICRPATTKLRESLDSKQLSACKTCEYGILACLSTYSRAFPHPLLVLSKSEILVAQAGKSGRETKEIADTIGISVKTVENHRYRIRSKLSISNLDVELKDYLSMFELEY